MLYNIYNEAIIDVVEVDPEMPSVSKKYFNFFTTSRLQLFVDDAFPYIQNTAKNYDVIIMDAYIGDEVPNSLTTTDFLLKIKMRLSPRGTFIANIMTWDKNYFENQMNKISEVFQEIWMLP